MEAGIGRLEAFRQSVSRGQSRRARPHRPRRGVESERLFAATIALVNEHWQAIARVAKALERHDRIDQGRALGDR